MLKPVIPERSDKPPVKVKFLPENEDISPGWSRKNEAALWKSILEDMEGPESRGINESSDFPPVGSDVPVSPSNRPGMIEPTPSRPSEAGIEVSNKTSAPSTAESIETQPRKQLSLECFDKAQRFIEQDGRKEGLRRLRETDPEAAAQFEREQRERKMNIEP